MGSSKTSISRRQTHNNTFKSRPSHSLYTKCLRVQTAEKISFRADHRMLKTRKEVATRILQQQTIRSYCKKRHFPRYIYDAGARGRWKKKTFHVGQTNANTWRWGSYSCGLSTTSTHVQTPVGTTTTDVAALRHKLIPLVALNLVPRTQNKRDKHPKSPSLLAWS